MLSPPLRLGSLCDAISRFGGELVTAGIGGLCPTVGDSTITECLGFAGDVLIAGSACPALAVGIGTADLLRLTPPYDAMGRYAECIAAVLSRAASMAGVSTCGEGGDPTSEFVRDVPAVVATVPACEVCDVRVLVLKLLRTLLSCCCSIETAADEAMECASASHDFA